MSESGYSSDEDCFLRDELIRLKKSFRVRGLLRKAAHGDIYLANTRDHSKLEVILKMVKKRKTSTSYLNGRRVPNEAKIHSQAYQADPTGTVAYLDCFERVVDFVIAMEKPVNSLDLLEFVNEYGQLDMLTAKSITAQLGRSSLLYKQANLVHCDLKDENVLFNPLTGQTKIIDFGNAVYLDQVTGESFATPAYYSPELKKLNSPATTELDIDACTVYTIGCIVFTLLTGSSPFDATIEFDFQRHVQLNGNISKHERQLLSSLLADQSDRREALELLV